MLRTLAKVLGLFLGAITSIDSSSGDLPSFPVSSANWCTVGTTTNECVVVHAPVKPACDRDPETSELLRDLAGQPVPAGCHPHVTNSFDAGQCKLLPESAIGDNAREFTQLVLSVAEVAIPIYLSNLGQSCNAGSIRIYLLDQSPPDWVDRKIIGFTPELSESELCVLAVTSTPGESTHAPWLTASARVKGAVAHELFHCNQQFAGHSMSGPKWFLEGTAMFAEDVVGDEYQPAFDSDHDIIPEFFDPDPAFLSREHDAGTPLIFLRDQGTQHIGFELVKSNDPVMALTGSESFQSRWHQSSVATWNKSPVPLWTPDHKTISGTSAPESATELLSSDQLLDLSIDTINPLSYKTTSVSIDDTVGVISLRPTMADTTKASIVLQGGQNELVMELSSGDSIQICRRAVGECHERPDSELKRIELLGVIATNLNATQSAGVSIELDSHAPRLHGTWRTESLTGPNFDGLIQRGGMVSFDEEQHPDRFFEDLSGISIYPDNGACVSPQTTGAVSGNAITTYDLTATGMAQGSIEFDLQSNSARFKCMDQSGNVSFSGATPGLGIMGYQHAPWSPIQFRLEGDTLELNSRVHAGVQWQMVLTRVSMEP